MLNLFKSINNKKNYKFKKLNKYLIKKTKTCNIKEFEEYFYSEDNFRIINKFLNKVINKTKYLYKININNICYIYLINNYSNNIFSNLEQINLAPYIKLSNKIISFFDTLDINNKDECYLILKSITEFNGLICFYTIYYTNEKYNIYINNTLTQIEKTIDKLYNTFNFTNILPEEIFNEQQSYINDIYIIGNFGGIIYLLNHLKKNNLYDMLNDDIKQKFKDYLIK